MFHIYGSAIGEPFELPDDIKVRCLALMKKLGLVTASLDIAVCEEGKAIFLELNQGGQFLWLEAFGLPVLQAFAFYLMGKKMTEILPDLSLKSIMADPIYQKIVIEDRDHIERSADAVMRMVDRPKKKDNEH